MMLLSSYMTEWTNVLYADAAWDSQAVSANSVLSGNFIDDVDVEIPEEMVPKTDIEWESWFIFGGADKTTILEYSGPFGDVVIPAKATAIAENAFDNKKFLLQSIKCAPDSRLEVIGNNVFSNCEKLSSVEFPDSLKTIGNDAFRNTVIRDIKIPDNVTSLGQNCFADNAWLASASLGKGLIRIGDNVFNNCDKLRSLHIECNQAASVGDNIFKGCILKEVTFGKNMDSIPLNLFAYADFAKGSVLIIPKNIIYIQKKAFYKANNLDIQVEGEHLQEIFSSAFEGTDISNAYLPKSVVNIHEAAFKDCKNIKDFTVPYNTEIIGSEAFMGCKNLRKVVAHRNLTHIGEGAFTDCNAALTFYVLKDSYAQLYANKRNINCVEGYNIVYKIKNGLNNPANPMLYVPGETEKLYDPYRVGFKFHGWYLDKKFKNKVEDTSAFKGGTEKVYASWSPIEYGVSYVLGGDDVNNRKNEKRIFRTCAKPFKVRKPTRKGFMFDGWYMNPEFTGNPIEEIPVNIDYDVILYAKWKENTYNIVYNANGGIVTRDAKEKGLLEPIIDVPFSGSVQTPVAGLFESRVEEGYINTGWNRDRNGNINNGKGVHYDFGEYTSRLTKTKGKNVKLYAEWTPIEYSITYVLNGGVNNAKNPDTHNVTKSVQLYKPRKPGATFKGWYSDPEYTNRVRIIGKNYPSAVTLYAKWD